MCACMCLCVCDARTMYDVHCTCVKNLLFTQIQMVSNAADKSSKTSIT